MKIFLRLNGADGGCAACPNAAGVDEFPPVLTGTPIVLSGGFAGFAVMRSDLSWTNITLEAEWESKIAANTLLVRMNGCRVKGSKGDSTTVKRTRGACSAEEVVKREQTWEITDVGNDDEYTMHDLYNYLQANYACYRIAFITCDYRLYGFVSPSNNNVGQFMSMTAFFADDNIPETKDDDALLKLSATTSIDGLVKPMALSFLPNLTGLIN